MKKRDFFTKLVYMRTHPLFGKAAYILLKLLGIEIPRNVTIDKDFLLVHGGFGVVIHPKTRIGQQVKIYPGVTLGRADIHMPIENSLFSDIVVEDNVILAPGSKILCRSGTLIVRQGTVVGANAVLLESTNPWEIWAGVPAKKIGVREHTQNRKT